jgi:transposase
MPAKYVRPNSKGQKNDFRDAEAIAEAVQRRTMKFVATKSVDQLDLQALHRVRERLVSQRTGIVNQIRAFLLERGIAIRQGPRFLRIELPRVLADPCEVLSPRMARIIEGLADDWRRLDERIEGLSREIEAMACRDAGCERLMSVPGAPTEDPDALQAMAYALVGRAVLGDVRALALLFDLIEGRVGRSECRRDDARSSRCPKTKHGTAADLDPVERARIIAELEAGLGKASRG